MIGSSGSTIRQLFNSMSGGYDRFNTGISLGLHRIWQRQAVDCVKPGMRVLDLGTGTGDLAFLSAQRLLGRGEVVGVDFSEAMLALAQNKCIHDPQSGLIRWVRGGAADFFIPEPRFDAVLCGFLLRNVQDEIHQVLARIRDGLRPGGVLSVLDVFRPESAWRRGFLRLFMRTAGTLWARVTLKDPRAIRYFEESISRFLTAQETCDLLMREGFGDVCCRSLFGGAVYHLQAIRL
ncbi:MAG: class I SAM-dependent methyltransferase [Candidatus Omnitrophica bacterium]|nr:class I SAM-dependent methyltransferase [Candidatus Omnitrophota bacterium]